VQQTRFFVAISLGGKEASPLCLQRWAVVPIPRCNSPRT